jgi:hypothetical protein
MAEKDRKPLAFCPQQLLPKAAAAAAPAAPNHVVVPYGACETAIAALKACWETQT